MPWMPFIIYAVVSSFTPGPNNIMAMTFASQTSVRRTLRFCVGVSVGFFSLIVASSVFGVLLATWVPKIEWGMKIIGAIYLTYLAYQVWKSTGSEQNNEQIEANNRFFTGVVMQFVNPKAIFYAITVMSSFVIPYYTSPLSLFLFACLLGGIGFLSSFSWSMLGGLFQTWIERQERLFNGLMAVLLLYCAVALFL